MQRNRLFLAIGIAVVIVVVVAVVVLVVLPTPASSPKPISVQLLQLSATSEPHPTVRIVLGNNGSVSVTNLSAYLNIGGIPGFNFPNVTAATPLEPRESASASTAVPNGALACGTTYAITISGALSSGSSFRFTATHAMTCAPPP